jgi:hypothetical protein
MPVSNERIIQEIRTQITQNISVAPREVAQGLAMPDEDWRRYLPRIRQQAMTLAHNNELVFLRKKKPVNPENLKGVYRLAASVQTL